MSSASPGGVDPTQPIPLYLQLKTLLMEEILRGRYGPNAQIPTEHELCETYQISRTPVSRALSELAEEGVILRHRRRGTFVNPHWAPPATGTRELRVVVPEGPWERLIRDAAPDDVNLNIATVSLPELHQVLVHAVAEGRAPDLAVLDSVWVAEFAAAGFLYPLDEIDPDWVAQEYEPDFFEAFVDATRFRGRPVAVAAEADVAGVWYRRAALAGTEVERLNRWQDLARAGDALASLVPAPIVLPGGSRAGETTSYCLLALLASNGARVLEPDRVTLHSAATVECLEFLRDLVRRGLIPQSVVTYEWDQPIRELGQGRAAICFGGSYEAPALAAAAGLSAEKVWAEFGFAGIPQGPRGGAPTLAGAMVHGIFRQATNPGVAMRLLGSLVSADSLARMSRSTGQLPSRRAAIPVAADASPIHAASLDLLGNAVVRPVTAAYPRVSAQLQVMLEAVLVGRLEPAAASMRAAEMISAITGLPVLAD